MNLDALRVVDVIARTGSFSAAALALDRVPSAVTYTVRRLETDLGVTLFERQGRGTRLTPAGATLLHEGRQLLRAADRLAGQVQRTAGGWESALRIAVNGIMPFARLRPLIEDFRSIGPNTRLVFRHEVLSGAWEAVADDRADLVIGATSEGQPLSVTTDRIEVRPMGCIRFVYCMARNHPLAALPGTAAANPVPDPDPAPGPVPEAAPATAAGRQGPALGVLATEQLLDHCAIVVGDTTRHGEPRSAGLLAGQPVISVATLEHKLALLLAGTGVGFLPLTMARPALADGSLVAREVALRNPEQQIWFAWQRRHPGKGLAWWIDRLSVPLVQQRLLGDS